MDPPEPPAAMSPVLPATSSAATEEAHPQPPALFPIVGIGASAGGLEALQLLLKRLPPSTGLAFVVVQHLDPKHESMLVDILSRATAMPVSQATDGVLVEPDHVYVMPPISAFLGALSKSRPVHRDRVCGCPSMGSCARSRKS